MAGVGDSNEAKGEAVHGFPFCFVPNREPQKGRHVGWR